MSEPIRGGYVGEIQRNRVFASIRSHIVKKSVQRSCSQSCFFLGGTWTRHLHNTSSRDKLKRRRTNQHTHKPLSPARAIAVVSKIPAQTFPSNTNACEMNLSFHKKKKEIGPRLHEAEQSHALELKNTPWWSNEDLLSKLCRRVSID